MATIQPTNKLNPTTKTAPGTTTGSAVSDPNHAPPPPGSSTSVSANNSNANPPLNFSECLKYLSSRHTAAMEALASNQIPPSEKPELYKPPGANSLSGGWGSGKYTSMANGSDFVMTLLTKIEQRGGGGGGRPGSGHP